MDKSVIEGYKSNHKRLIKTFETIDSSVLLSYVIGFFPDSPSFIADIGAGTGRESAWFASQGHKVLAVEPVDEFRTAGRKLHPDNDIEWIDDSLPFLEKVRQKNYKFDLVTVIAVWQHINDEYRVEAMKNLRSITGNGGRIVFSLRNGPGAENRKCYPIDIKETVKNIESSGLTVLFCKDSQSVQSGNRLAGVTWHWVVAEVSD